MADPADAAVRAIEGFVGARVLAAAGSRLCVEVTGGADQGSALLRRLLDAGVTVVMVC